MSAESSHGPAWRHACIGSHDRRARDRDGRPAIRSGEAFGRGKAQANGPRGPRRAVPGRPVLGGIRSAGHPYRAGDGRRGSAALHPAGHPRDRSAAGRPGDLLPPGHRGLPEWRRRLCGGQGASRRQAKPDRGGVARRRLRTQRGGRRVGWRRGADVRVPESVPGAGVAVPGRPRGDHGSEPVGSGRVSPAVYRPDYLVHRRDLRRHHRRSAADASAPLPAGARLVGRHRWACCCC